MSPEPQSQDVTMDVPASRREHGKARVRAGLLSAARLLFARRGVADTTMDDVAHLAGVSRATAFNYFPSKNLLLSALVHEMESRFLHLIEAQFESPGTAAERIAALFSWTAAKVEETPELSRVLIGASETTFGAAPGLRGAHRADAPGVQACPGCRAARGQRAARRAYRGAGRDSWRHLRRHPARLARGYALRAASPAGCGCSDPRREIGVAPRTRRPAAR